MPFASEKEFPELAKPDQIGFDNRGRLWVCWPKKASGVATDVTEDLVRARALAARLVDVKVCAIDETWSGLKLVVPVKDRPRPAPAPRPLARAPRR